MKTKTISKDKKPAARKPRSEKKKAVVIDNSGELERMREWERRIHSQRAHVQAAQIEVDSLSEQLRAAKKDLDSQTAALLAIIDEKELSKTQPGLFETSHTESLAEVVAEVVKPAKPQDDESWRAVTLEQLGIVKPRIVKALSENDPPLTTLGAIADATETNGNWWHRSVKGLGEKSAEQVSDACAKYWEQHPRQVAPVASSELPDIPEPPTATAPQTSEAQKGKSSC